MYLQFYGPHFTLVKDALIAIDCGMMSLSVGWLVGWLVTWVDCGQTVHPRPVVTIKHLQEVLRKEFDGTFIDPLR